MSYLQTSFHNIILSVLIGFEVWIPTSNYPHSRGVNNWHSNWNYPLVNKYSNGISPCSIGNTSSEGLLSIAMITYQSVPLSASPSNYCFIQSRIQIQMCISKNSHDSLWKKSSVTSPSLRKKSLKIQVLLESVQYVGCFETGVHCLKCEKSQSHWPKWRSNFLDRCLLKIQEID